MPRLTIFQQELWDRWRQAVEGEEFARGHIEALKAEAAERAKDAKMYRTMLEREGIDVEKRQATLEKASQAAPSKSAEPTAEPQANGLNKTHAVIDVFQRYGENGFGPKELWEKAVEVYPDGNLTASYVNTLVGKLLKRELITRNGGGRYQLTDKGREFIAQVNGL